MAVSTEDGKSFAEKESLYLVETSVLEATNVEVTVSKQRKTRNQSKSRAKEGDSPSTVTASCEEIWKDDIRSYRRKGEGENSVEKLIR